MTAEDDGISSRKEEMGVEKIPVVHTEARSTEDLPRIVWLDVDSFSMCLDRRLVDFAGLDWAGLG